MPTKKLYFNFNGTGAAPDSPVNTHLLFIKNEAKKERKNAHFFDLPGVACDPDFSGKNPDQVLTKLLESDTAEVFSGSPIGQMFEYIYREKLSSARQPTIGLFKDIQHVRNTVNGNGVFSQALIALLHTYNEINEFVKQNPGQDLQLDILSLSHSRGGVASVIYSNLVNEFILPHIEHLKNRGQLGKNSQLTEAKVLHDTVIGADTAEPNYERVMSDSVYKTFKTWQQSQTGSKNQPQNIYTNYVKPPLPSFVKTAQVLYAQNETRYYFVPYIVKFDPQTQVSKFILPEYHNAAISGADDNAGLQTIGIIKGLSTSSFMIKHNANLGFNDDYGRSKIQAHYYLMLQVFNEYNNDYLHSTQKPTDFITWCQNKMQQFNANPQDKNTGKVVAMLKQVLTNYAEFKTRPDFFETGTLTPAYMMLESSSVRDLSGINSEAKNSRVFYDAFHEKLFYAIHNPTDEPKFSAGVNIMNFSLTDPDHRPSKNPYRIDLKVPVRYPLSSLLNAMGIESLRTKQINQRETSGRSVSNDNLRDFLLNPLSPKFIGELTTPKIQNPEQQNNDEPPPPASGNKFRNSH